MPEDDEVKGFQSVQGSISSFSDDSDSDLDIIDKLKATDEYKELMSLKKLRTLKLSTGDERHDGYQCDGCGQEPIMGVRYHCQDCPLNTA
ncbi:ZZ-type zinc finger-containing protein 3-like [Watersipora subatra]|uniref:ZZ-type zinc finger-containing protein 3-like n=1 Tax=Watersipora subatra TaxID=2589382 RepID=UPI00355AE2CD